MAFCRLRGKILAGKPRLPMTIDLDGDTRIVFRQLQLSGHTLAIDAHDHAIHFYPINGVTAGVTLGSAA